MSSAAANGDLEFGGRVTLEDGFSRVADQVSRRFRALRADFTSSIGGMGRSILGLTGSLLGISRFLSPAGLAMGLGGFVRSAIRSSSEMENLRIAFTTMLGSANAAGEHLRMLQQFAVGKPFEFRDLVVASRNLQTFGFGAVEVRGLLQDFGDAAFNAGTGLRGVNAQVNVFGTILATNKVTFGQLRMLVRAGVPAFQILRDQLHLTDQQLRNIAHSTLRGREIIDALRRGMQQRFAGGMDRAAQTISARISDLNDVAGIFLSQVGDELRPTIIGFLNELGQGITRTDFALWARRVSEAISTLARVGRIALAPFMGAFADVSARWDRDQGRAVRPLRRFLANFRDVVQGVEALLSSEGTGGIASIPASLQRTLIDRVLWPITVRIARWGDRMRAVVGGFIEGVVSEIRIMGGIFQSIAARLGLFSGSMNITHERAMRLGRALVVLLAVTSSLRTLTTIYTVATNAASLAMSGYRLACIGARIAQQNFYLAQMRSALGMIRWLEVLKDAKGLSQMLAAIGYLRVRELAAAASTRVLAMSVRGLNLAMAAGPYLPLLAFLALVVVGTVLLAKNWHRVAAGFERIKPFVAVLATMTLPITAMVAAFLAVPVAIAWAYNNWHRFTTGVSTTGASAFGAVRKIAHAFRLVSDVIRVVSFLVSYRLGRLFTPAVDGARSAGRAIVGFYLSCWTAIGRAAMAVGRGIVGAFVWTGEFLYAFFGGFASLIFGAIVRIFPAFGLFAIRVSGVLRGIRGAVRGVFEGMGTGVASFFDGLFESIIGKFRAWAGDLVAMMRALPARMQPAGLADSIARLDAFAHGGQAPGTPPAPTPAPGRPGGAPQTPAQAVVQRTQAQARVAGTSPAPVVHVTAVTPPVTTVVQVEGREIARAVQRHGERENLRGGGSGSQD